MRDRCDRLIGHAGECSSATQAQASDAPASPWVRASERQPGRGCQVLCRMVKVPGAMWIERSGDAPSGSEWLDLDAVDRLAAENAELRAQITHTNDVFLDRIADLERERDELRDRYESARSVADRAETAARDAADRLAAYATGGTDNQRDPRTTERLRALGTRLMR